MAESEIELKLNLDPNDVARFRRDPAIHRAKQGRAKSKSLLAVYFDTPDLTLRGAKMALRIRQEGRDRIQTLKIPDGGTGLSRRTEYNAPTDGRTPDLDKISDEAVRADVAARIGKADLLPAFSTDIRRTIWLLDLPGAMVELALDLGEIHSGDKSVAVCEAELELKAGNPLALLEFARGLADRYPCHVSESSKAARGYGLFRPTASQPQKAKKLKLDTTAPAWNTLTRIVEEGTAQLFANEAAVLVGTDIAGVHQSRVAVRRMRAALSAFRPIVPEALRKPLNKSLRRHQVDLGPARDWDVFLAETLDPLLAAPEASKALREFADRARAAQTLAYKRAHKAIASARYGRLQLELIVFAHTPLPDGVEAVSTEELARRLLDERLAVVMAAANGHPAQLEEVALHAFRIDIKKFRYALDFFISIYDQKSISAWRSVSKALQDCLGGLNDTVVQRSLLDAMDAPDRPVRRSVRRLIEEHNAVREAEGLAKLNERWEEFRALRPFWR